MISNTNNNCPCKGCDNRHIACHGNCNKYVNWKEEYKNRKNIIIEIKNKERMINSYFVKSSINKKRYIGIYK